MPTYKKQAKINNKDKLHDLDIKVKFKNFGPLTSGELELKPLTVLIGPNNSGKSYVSLLLRSLFVSRERFSSYGQLLTELGPHAVQVISGRSGSPLTEKGPLVNSLNKILDKIKDSESGVEYEFSGSDIGDFLAISTIFWVHFFQKEIIGSFGPPIHELSRVGKHFAPLQMRFSFNSNFVDIKLDKKNDKLYATDSSLENCLMKLVKTEYHTGRKLPSGEGIVPNVGLQVKIEFQNGNECSFYQPAVFVAGEINVASVQTLRLWIEAEIQKNALGFGYVRCFYLPAARSGILAGHKALASLLVDQSRYVGTLNWEVPKVAPVVASFIADILGINGEAAPLYKLVSDLEKTIIDGEIYLSAAEQHQYPEINYKFGDMELPLNRTSSMVSELAPLFLYAKYKIRPGDFLMIEEPEAHLHPKVQRFVAQFLVRLIRNGVRVLITTHSEYLLEQLSNFVMLSQIGPEVREQKYGKGKDDYLNVEEVAAYLFKRDGRSKGYKVHPLEVNEEDGISEEGFSEVHEALYDELVRLERDIAAAKSRKKK